MPTAPGVVVTGMGAWTAFGRGVGALWRGALDGRSAIGPVGRFDTRRFRSHVAALIEDDALAGEEPGALGAIFAHAAAEEALTLDGRTGTAMTFGGARAGVVVGTTLGEGTAVAGGPARAPGSLARGLAARHDARGPVSTVSVACASGTTAIGLAAEWIRCGDADRVLAGGVDAISPFVFSGFDALRALSPLGARPFDAARDGLTLGDGAGFLLLENETFSRARGARILARVSGYGSASDAHHMTRPDPAGLGLVRAVAAALSAAGRGRGDLGLVSAHGTGTVFNDAMEEAALAHVLGPFARTVPVQGIKGAIGHTLGAAGALEAILSVLVLERQRVPPTAGHLASRPDSPLAIVAGQPLIPHAPIRVALSTSAAFGGTNAALVLECP